MKTRRKRNKKRNFFGAWRKCHGDPAKILERIGATLDDYNEWMKDPAFVERFEEAVENEPFLPDDAEGLLLLAKELPIFKRYDITYAIAKLVAALPEKERTAYFQRLRDAETTVDQDHLADLLATWELQPPAVILKNHEYIIRLRARVRRRTFNYRGRKVTLVYNPDFRKKVESKVKQCLSGRFKPGFHSKKDKQIAELICDQSLTDRERARKAGMTVGAFKTLKSAWMKNIASISSPYKGPLPSWKRHRK